MSKAQGCRGNLILSLILVVSQGGSWEMLFSWFLLVSYCAWLTAWLMLCHKPGWVPVGGGWLSIKSTGVGRGSISYLCQCFYKFSLIILCMCVYCGSLLSLVLFSVSLVFVYDNLSVIMNIKYRTSCKLKIIIIIKKD